MDMFSSDSEWDSSSECSTDNDIGDLRTLYDGQASNILSSMEETIGKIDDLLLFKRGFVHGDIVRSRTDPFGLMGKVVNVKITVDLENIHGKVVKNIDSKQLLKIRSISAGDFVIHGPWIGRVDKVLDNVSILQDDGTKWEMIVTDQEKLVPVGPNVVEDSIYPYYPGQRVHIKLSNFPKSARWLCGDWKESHDVGTVASVKAGLVYVDWLACAVAGSDFRFPSPSCLQSSQSLTPLSCFPHENWQVGDWCMLPTADTTDLQEIFVIAKRDTVVDVMWQDGSVILEIDSESLIPVNVVNAHEFWPGQFVLEKSVCDIPSGDQKWGVVIKMNSKERTVKVEWMSTGMNPRNNERRETVSAYELVDHPDYSFCHGDVVVKNGDKVGKNCTNRGNRITEDFMCSSDDYLSCIGCVAGFQDGAVQVTWASGSNTLVAPGEIFHIDKCEAPSAILPLHEQNADEASQVMVDQEKQTQFMQGKDLLICNETDKETKTNQDQFSSVSVVQSTIGFFSRIAASFLGSLSFLSARGTKLRCISEEAKRGNDIMNLETYDQFTEMQPLVASIEQEVHIQENEKVQSSPTTNERFRQFDLVGDCFDHHFLAGAAYGSALSQVSRAWLKKVHQEWDTLEHNLPESIYVRVCEERLDLIRAAIIGVHGTPYHDGLFFFDIYLPPEYPNAPPLVRYRSGGLRVNPNLYESGKVCLSLLNTWTGTGRELWNPESSSILQILLSLQALVLNDKPYFNEAGYDKQMGGAEGEKNSISYNENAFLLTWKSMLYILRQPPKNFEALVEEHLRRRSSYILTACKAYMEGAPVGNAFGSRQIDEDLVKCNSTGFKIMLAKLFPKLVQAFSEKGIDCSLFAASEK